MGVANKSKRGTPKGASAKSPAATMTWQNASENFSDSSHERKAHERAMLAASDAEREAHVLLATLKRFGA